MQHVSSNDCLSIVKVAFQVTELGYFTWKVLPGPAKADLLSVSLNDVPPLWHKSTSCTGWSQDRRHIRSGWPLPPPCDILLCVLSLCSLWECRWVLKKKKVFSVILSSWDPFKKRCTVFWGWRFVKPPRYCLSLRYLWKAGSKSSQSLKRRFCNDLGLGSHSSWCWDLSEEHTFGALLHQPLAHGEEKL